MKGWYRNEKKSLSVVISKRIYAAILALQNLTSNKLLDQITSGLFLNVDLDMLYKAENRDLRNIADSFLYKCKKILTYNEKCSYIIWQLCHIDRKPLI